MILASLPGLWPISRSPLAWKNPLAGARNLTQPRSVPSTYTR